MNTSSSDTSSFLEVRFSSFDDHISWYFQTKLISPCKCFLSWRKLIWRVRSLFIVRLDNYQSPQLNHMSLLPFFIPNPGLYFLIFPEHKNIIKWKNTQENNTLSDLVAQSPELDHASLNPFLLPLLLFIPWPPSSVFHLWKKQNLLAHPNKAEVHIPMYLFIIWLGLMLPIFSVLFTNTPSTDNIISNLIKKVGTPKSKHLNIKTILEATCVSLAASNFHSIYPFPFSINCTQGKSSCITCT